MICPGCGHGVGERARFCEACGASLPEATASVGPPAASGSGSRARAHAALPALIAYLQREGRVSYRVLAHVFSGDQAFLDEAREELAFRGLARDEHGQGLVWTAEARSAVPSPVDTARVQPAPPVAEAVGAPAVPVPDDVGQAERRHLTVMFCDLADSTVLAGRLDAEDLHEVIRSYQATAAEVVDRYGGHIAQYLGDGLLVYFGWPEAHEDDASRAVHAGLEIAEAIATTLNPRLTRDKGVRLAVRVGIHTGPVVVGGMGGDGRRENLATGETVNIAARLEGLTAHGTVVISQATSRLMRDAFVLEALGPTALKGVAEPMPVYRVLGPAEAREVDPMAARAPFVVGRGEELGLLRRLWEQCKEGLGHAVLVSGAGGIGKSTVVEVLRAHVKEEGLARIVFRCSPYHRNIALYPVVTHLVNLLQLGRQDPPSVKLDKLEEGLRRSGLPLEEAVPLFAALFSIPVPEERYPALDLTPPQHKQRTFDALVAWLLGEAERHPVLTAWEDLHWADPSTLEVLGLVLDQAPTVPMLHVLTFRPEFELPWPRRSHMTPITLNRLERPQVEALITHRAGGKALPAEVVSHIVAKTDGVPLYVEELTKMLLASPLLRAEGEQYVLTGPLSTVSIPDTLQDSLMARLDQLRAAKEVAQLGAVLGREFAYDVLRAIAPMDEAALQDGLHRLVEAELLYQRGRPPRARYLFKHALIQDAAYASLLRSARQQVHANVAQALTAKLPELAETQPELLAHHYAQAGLPALALAHWQAAAVRAIRRSAYVEAIHSIEQALTQLTQLPLDEARDRRELELLVMTLGPLIAVKGYASPEVDAASGRALALCRILGDHETLFPTLYARWAAQYVLGHQGEAYALSREYLDQARAVGDDAGIVVGNRIHAVALLMRGDVEGAQGLAREALSLYVPERHQPLIARFGQDLKVQSLNYLAVSVALAGRLDEAWKLGEESLAHARSLNHINTLAYTLWHIGVWLAAVLRRPDTVQRVGAELLDLSRTHRLGRWGAIVSPFLERGDAAERALTVYRREFNSGLTVPQLLCHFGEDYLESGRTADARRVLTEAGDLMEQHGELYWEPELFRLRGRLAAAEGRGAPEAPTGFERALALARQRGAHLLELRAATDLARWRAAQGQRAAARQMLAPVYASFTEGFHEKDLKEAKAVLDELEASG
jgi:class 3 adenylate cyclase/predicted ATPase